jgi:hypothetical protein
MQTTDPSQWKKSNVAKLSVIIPAWNELYLKATVDGILKSATGDIEVIVMLDGYWPHELPADDPRLILVHRKRGGMRAAINGAVAIAKGEFILKADAHCLFAPGFDETLKADCDKDWIVWRRILGKSAGVVDLWITNTYPGPTAPADAGSTAQVMGYAGWFGTNALLTAVIFR